MHAIAISGEEARPASGEADDWITINKDYSGQRYVDLDQITPGNVGRLKETCEIRLNEPSYFNSGILKVDKTLYVTTQHATYAFDASTCQSRWREVVDLGPNIAGLSNRGVGYLDGMIFRGTSDGRLLALDASTGDLIWQKQAAIPKNGESFISAPIAWAGKVFSGIGVSDNGIAGRMMAFDAHTGNEIWRFDTTLKSKSGGGLWTTYSLDTRTGEVFGSVANPYPDFSRAITPDDKKFTKYTNSVISVDTTTGRLIWHYQAVPHDEHDWDLAAAPILYRTPTGKRMLAVAGKSGRVYGVDRDDMQATFDTPGTTLENDREPLANKWMHVCPGLQGGAMFNGPAYHPGLGTLFVGMNDHCAWYLTNKAIPGSGGDVIKDWAAAAKLQAPHGWITAMDGQTGAVLWRYQTGSQVLAGLVPTRSGLLFAGDTHGSLLAFDAKRGVVLNRIDAGGALNSGLISYSVDGVQFIAAAVGGSSENPSTVAGPLSVKIYRLCDDEKPTIVTLPRLEPSLPGFPVGVALFVQNCQQCHGQGGTGGSAPPIVRQSQLADPELLQQFLETVPPPMPRLYPGLLAKSELASIAEYLTKYVFNCGPDEPQSCTPPAKPMTGGTPAWQAIYSVLTYPRCINCHTIASPNLPPYAFDPATNAGYPQDYPRQGDDRHPHYYAVLRGNTVAFQTAEKTGIVYPGTGTDYEHCTFCHGTENDPVTGIPGTHDLAHPDEPFWFMAPALMAWETAPGVPMTGAELCAALKDKKRNGNRELGDLLSHIQNEPLVKWSFDPGTRPNGEPRTVPPLSHGEFVEVFQQWMAAGAPCPAE
jgi:alcohol dehydrogenase (cytochrome c)